jgi:hypothetical protein
VGVGVLRAQFEQLVYLLDGLLVLGLVAVYPGHDQAAGGEIRVRLYALLAHHHGLDEAPHPQVGLRQRDEGFGVRIGGELVFEFGEVSSRIAWHPQAPKTPRL